MLSYTALNVVVYLKAYVRACKACCVRSCDDNNLARKKPYRLVRGCRRHPSTRGLNTATILALPL